MSMRSGLGNREWQSNSNWADHTVWGMEMTKRRGSMTKRGEGYVGAVELLSV
jgi:hypothetical protein